MNLDVFFLIDTSGSMTGRPLEFLNNSIKNSIDDLFKDQKAKEKIRISIQTFNTKTYKTNELQALKSLSENFKTLGIAEGITNTGEALSTILNEINSTIEKYHINDFQFKKPLLFLITDGIPTDITTFNETIKTINFTNINKVCCGINVGGDISAFKSFSNKLILIDCTYRDSKSDLSQIISKTILNFLNSDDNNIENTGIFNPHNPITPNLTEIIELI
jgi:uncharacterized protein YegL